MRACVLLFELLWLTQSLSCQRSPNVEPKPRAAASASATRLAAMLAPRAASRFRMVDGALRQEQPRLPDTGEWRCAEQARVVWCTGGEAAAGVVSGLPDVGYRCAQRWGASTSERVCIDQQPDYPGPDY